MRKQTLKNVVFAVIIFCMFVGLMPQIAADYNTAQAAAATIYYDFRKGNNGYPEAAADKRTAFAALTYDEVAARNTTITSGPWAYHSFSATPDSSAASNDQTSFTSGSFFYYHYDKTKGFTMLTGSRQGVLTAGIKFKGMNAGKYVPYLNINGSYLRTYSGTLTAKIYPLNSSTPIVTKEICLSDYPEDDSYVQLSNAVSFSASEYVLELTINNERTITIINGLQLVAADSTIVTGLYPTNDLGVYEVKVGQTINVPFTQVLSDGTVTTNKLSGWGYTTDNSYVTAGVNSSSRYFTLKGVTETSTPQTVYFSIGNAKVKLNVIVRASNYTATQSDVVYNFKKARPANWSANHVHYFGKHIKYSHTAVGGYAEVNPAITSAPWKVSSIASTSEFSVLYDGYGIEHRGNGVTDIMIQVPVSGVYMPQIQIYTTEGVKSDVTVSLLTTGGSTVCSTTIPAGTKTEYVNLATNGVSISAQEYIVRFNKPSTGSSMQAGSNYYNGIKLVKTNNTTVTLDPNGGTAGKKTSVTATNGFPMPGVDGDGYLPTRTGYRFGGYYDGKNGVLGSGTQYYTMAGKSNHVWDKTSSTATLYASWNVNTYSVKYNANGGSGTMSNSSHTYDTAKALTANTFTRTGYTFAGWATSSSGSVEYADKASVKNLHTTNGGTKNLYAVWTPITYSVKYNANGGSGTMSNSSHTYGTAKALTANAFTKTGYTFQGWDTNSAGTTVVHTDKKSVSNLTSTNGGTVNLYAVWKANTYTVTLDANGGTGGTASVTATYGSAMPSATMPTRTGYTFAGYYDASSGGTQYYKADGKSAKAWDKTEAATLYARWTKNTYTVTLDANGGTGGTASVTATYASAMPSATMPTRTGYTFAGYYDATSGGTKYYNADGTSARSWNKAAATTLYARWTANTYTVTLHNMGATTAGTESTTATYNSAMPAITVPTKTGYTFTGYYSNSSGGTQYYKADGTSAKSWDKTSDGTLYAQWTANTYTVTLDPTNGTGGTASVTATYASAMPSATMPTRTGYTFAGYYDATSGGTKYYNADGTSARTWNKAAATTLYARWTKNTYTVTLDANGGTEGTTSVTATYASAMPSATMPTRTGYTFAGYYDATSGGTKYYNADGTSARSWNKAAATTLYARWTANTYTVTLDPTNGTGGTASVTATYGSAMPSATMPTRTGYTFKGYYDASSGGTQYYKADGTSAKAWDKTEAATLYARWTKNTYTVTLDANGGTGGTASVTATYASAMPSATMPTRTGYTFAGYYDAKSDGTKYYNADGTSARSWNKAAATTLYARWTANTYTVTLDANGGTAGTASVTATYGSAMPSATMPTRTGYTFAGYYDAKSGGTQYYKADGTSAKAWNKAAATTLYARWTANTYTVTLDANGGTAGTASVTATYNLAMPEIATLPTRTGYTFKGYYDASSGGTQYYKADGTSAKAWDKTEAATLYARWTKNTYTVTLDANGGTAGTESVTATYGSAMPSATMPTRTGYTFAGYYDATSGGTQYYKADGTSTRTWNKAEATTLYARWTANTYTVTLSEGGTVTATYNSAMPEITVPTKTGYTFGGYYIDAACTGTQYYKADGTSARNWTRTVDTTLYAKWTANTYTVKFNANSGSGTMSDQIFTYDVAQNLTANTFTREGYTFAGWSLNSVKYTDGQSVNNLATSGTVTLYATWTPNTYTVTLSEGGTVTATYNSAMPEIAVPTKTGYTFGGYYIDAACTGTQYYNADGSSARNWTRTVDTTLYAKWTANTYTVKFNANTGSGTMSDQIFTYDVAQNLTANTFTREGYTFAGWSLNSVKYTDGQSVNNLATSGTVTLYATWTPNTYTVTLSEGGTVTATYNSAMPEIAVPTKTGYIFGGYFTEENGEGTQYYKTDGTSAKKWDRTDDVTLYAKWIQGEVTITQIEDKTINIEEELTFTVEASSTAPSDITYTAENLPTGATFNEKTGEFSWTPTANQVGEYTIIFRGSDGLNYAEVTVKVEVVNIATTVTLDDGTNTKVITAIYGKAMPKIATTPTMDGYIFDGYFDGENGTGTRYYKADGTSARTWDKKDSSVTLYAKWVEGDDRFGVRIGGIKNMAFKNDLGKTMFRMYLFAGIDSLDYDEAGFEVTVDGVTKRFKTKTVFSVLNRPDKTKIVPSSFGPKCIRGIVISATFSLAYKDKTVTVRPYAVDFDGNYIYGKYLTIDGIYDYLVEGEDITVDGEVEFA